MKTNLQTTKIELAKLILGSDDAFLIHKIQEVIRAEDNDFWFELSEEQKNEIAISRDQIDSGATQEWDALKKKLL